MEIYIFGCMHFWSGFSLLWCVPCSATQSCPTLCDPVDCNPPGSFVHGILQAKILEWVALFQGIFLTQGLNQHLLHWQVEFFTTSANWEAHCMHVAIKKKSRAVCGAYRGSSKLVRSSSMLYKNYLCFIQ